MASISSLMGSSSSSSSIYGSRNSNIISGLASGLDTESMIEGMVESYKQKILGLQQDRTKLQWQQSAYQSISDKLVEFSRKYMSYTSTTNLFSNSFFNNAVITSTKGTYADLVTASGKSNSDVVLNGVQQLATAARYQTSASHLGATGTAAKGDAVELGDKMMLNNITGSLSISYNGNEKITVNFEETDDLFNDDGSLSMDKFKTVLEEKLKDQQLTNKDGDKVSASEVIDVEVTPDGGVSLKTNGNAVGGASVQVTGASGDFSKVVQDLDSVVDNKSGSFTIDKDKAAATVDGTKAEYLSGKSFSVSFNGQTKKITLGEITGTDNNAVKEAFQAALNDAFGDNRITVNDDGGALSFQVSSGDTLTISATESGVGEMVFGEGNSSISTYLNTSKSLGDIGEFDASTGTLTIGGQKLQGTAIKVDEADWVKQSDGTYKDKEGYTLDSEGYRVNSDGERLYEFDLTINGKEIGSFTQDTALETVLNSINSNAEAGVNVSYSTLTNQFVFTAKSTGAAEKIEMGDGLAKALFGDSSGYDKGQDAIFTATINGSQQTFTRSSNSVDLDGLKVTLEGVFNNELDTSKTTMADLGIKSGTMSFEVGNTNPVKIQIDVTEDMTVKEVEDAFQAKLKEKFPYQTDLKLQYDENVGYQVLKNGKAVQVEATDDAEKFLTRPAVDTNAEGVTFTTKTDTDTIVDAIKQMVEDYNAMVTEVKKAYSDMPLQQTNGSKYEPLTSEDEEGMTESEIEAYEEKAKTGILFMDRDLSSLYSELRSAVTPGGTDGSYLRSIGINTSYSDGLTTISLDESALRSALETDLDGVRDAFTKTKENGAATDGLMTSIQKITDKYAATTGATKGILIEKAGSQYAPTAALDNTMLDKMEEIDEEIETWQDKMSDKVDYYTNKFTQLEMLINQMNSQSSALAGLMGG